MAQVVFKMCVASFLVLFSLSEGNKDCFGMRCVNGGTLYSNSTDCQCACIDRYSGITCEQMLDMSYLPKGPYALPMSTDGCPEPVYSGWYTGYINITTKYPVNILVLQKTIDDDNYTISELNIDPVTHYSTKVNTVGPFGDHSIQLNFCYKINQHPYHMVSTWPAGDYAIYGDDQGCPRGFTGKMTPLLLPDVLHYNIDGYLPHYIIEKNDTENGRLQILVCHKNKNDSEPGTTQMLQWIAPFMLIKIADKNCTYLWNYTIMEEHIHILPENDTNIGDKTPLLQFCLYTPGGGLTDHIWEEYYVVPGIYRENMYTVEKMGISLPPDVSVYMTDKGWIYIIGDDVYDRAPLFELLGLSNNVVPWVVLDIGRRATVFEVSAEVKWEIYETNIDETNIDDLRQTLRYPVFYISDEKWSFLSNGAKRLHYTVLYNTLPHYTKRDFIHLSLFYQFLRPMEGIYMSMVGTKNSNQDQRKLFTDTIFSFKLFVYTNENQDACYQDLGMTNTMIEDYQISASSWQHNMLPYMARLYQSGWCADPNDMEPYIQIDVIAPTTINGIRLWNWKTITQSMINNRLTERFDEKGTRSFRIKHGLHLNGLYDYSEKEFIIDLTKPYEEVKTFLFYKPFLARYVKLFPTPIVNATCLKIEIIGCRKAVRTSLDCVSESRIVNVTTAYISPYEPRVIENISTWHDCANRCSMALEKCSGLMYSSSNTCILYRPTINNIFLRFVNIEDNILSMVICEKDVTHVQLSNVPTRDNSTRYDVTGEEVITSFRYPFPYVPGRREVWHIHFEEGEFIRLVFTNVSLYDYAIDWNESTREKNDTIAIVAQEHDNRVYSLTSTVNGLQPIVATSETELYIIFTSEITNHRAVTKSGFRVIVLKEDVPSCFSFRLDFANCTQPSGYLASLSHYGYSTLSENLFIQIESHRTRLIILNFLEFYIACDYNVTVRHFEHSQESLFIEKSYCNRNKPTKYIRSLMRLIIEYGPVPYTEFRGFKAHYRIEKLDVNYLNLTTIRHDSPFSSSITLCSVVLNKCYVVSEAHNFFTPNWNEAELMCKRQNMTLVVIHSRLELDYIRVALVSLVEETFLNNTIFCRICQFYAHIGLQHYLDNAGVTREVWADNSPLIFSAWNKLQPLYKDRLRCTRMMLFILDNEDTWETEACDTTDYRSSHYSICQSLIHIDTSLITRNLLSNHNISSNGSRRDNGQLFLCGSGEYISILYLCDDLPNCQDNSDEHFCKIATAGVMRLNNDTLWFQCLDGGYIHLSYTCNFIQNCEDNSDEDCVFPECQVDEIRCENFQCIPEQEKCNAVKNCIDGSDETNCDNCIESELCAEDRICISSESLCDNQKDCSDGQDESECRGSSYYAYKFFSRDCLTWWRYGYRTNGTYQIQSTHSGIRGEEREKTVECIFKYIDNNTLSVQMIDYSTTYYHGQDRFLDYNINIISNQLCTLQVTQTCVPGMLEAANYDGIYYGKMNSECACVTLKMTTRESNQYIYCNNASYTPFDPQDASIITMPHVFRDENIIGNSSSVDMKYIRVTPSPLTCYTEVDIRSYENVFQCTKDDNIIPDSKRCLYAKDIYGNTIGCHSHEHLQDCEKINCPVNYVKCPDSYCLATELICDGINHCIDGEDELNCWCQEEHGEIAIVYTETRNDILVANVRALSQHLASKHNAVTVIRIRNDVFMPDNPKYYLTETVVGKSRDTINDENNFAFLTLDKMNLYFKAFFKNGSSNQAFIFIKENNFLEAMALPNSLVRQYFVSLGVSDERNYQVTRSNQDMITEIRISTWKLLGISGNEVFPDLCKDVPGYVCSNGYICSNSRVCISLDKLCDGQIHCPSGDDEYLCDFICPDKCTCRGFNVFCRNSNFTNTNFEDIPRKTRSLDISQNKDFKEISFDMHLSGNFPLLIKLNLSKCFVKSISYETFSKTVNIRVLDLSYNTLKQIEKDTFKILSFLKILILEGSHHLTRLMPGAFNGLFLIKELSLTHTLLYHILPDSFTGLNLRYLDISKNRINQISDYAFNKLSVATLIFDHNDITIFGRNMFAGMLETKRLHSPAYKFCCVRPSFVAEDDCFPSKDEFSSCADLMRNSALQTIMWVIGSCAVLGNAASLIYRLRFDKERLKLGYGIFVVNLSIADLLMGIYLLIIAVADAIFRNRYITNDDYWRTSGWCSLAGVLSTLSSEASVLFVCLITIDRMLVVKYPFGQIRINQRSAIISSIIIWIIVFGLAMLPIVHYNYFQNKFYTKTAVCIALPLTRDRPPGWLFSVLIFIGFNFLTFTLIAIGQWMIYREVEKSRTKNIIRKSGSRMKDLKVARNLLLVVTTDFLCWFPIGCMGLMALNGHAIPGDVYAWSAVFLLPINFAMNPFLYTLSAIVNRKKFTPNIDEQNPNGGQTDLVVIKNILRILASRYFKRREDTINPGKSLKDMVLVKIPPVSEITKIILQLARCLNALHNNSMVQKQLSMTTITVKLYPDEETVDHIVLPMPRQTDKSNDYMLKADDIYNLGYILRTLIKDYRSPKASLTQ